MNLKSDYFEDEDEEQKISEKTNSRETALSVKNWLKIIILMSIPVLNILLYIKWIASDKTNVNLRNFLIALSLVVAVLVWIAGMGCLYLFFGNETFNQLMAN